MLQLKKFLQWNNKQEAFFDVAVKERFLFINKDGQGKRLMLK